MINSRIVILAGLLALCTLGIVPESQVPMTFDQTPYGQAAQLIDIGGRNVNLYCTGSGTPTVILDLGFGDPLLAWGYVQPGVAKFTRVCSYERAGYGFSDPGPLPRTTDAIVNDLHALLQIAKIAPPYLMVGHSFGGLDVRLFADRYPSDVSGIVLVDPAVEGWDEIMDQMFPLARTFDAPYFARMSKCEALARQGLLASGSPSRSSCIDAADPRYTPEVAAARSALKEHPGYWATLASEAQNVDTADVSEMKAEQRSYGAMPMIVLTAVPHPVTSAYNATDAQVTQVRSMWNDLHNKVAAESQRGVNCLVSDTGHHIQLYKPEVVVAAIQQVMDLAHSTTKPSCEVLPN